MNKIKERRELTGITQNGLAEALGVDRSAIAKWETGKALPRADKIPKIAEILNCSTDDLFKDSV